MFRSILSKRMVETMRDFKTAWVSQPKAVEKPWGTELTWSSMINGVHGKMLNIHAGEMTSLKYYPLKNEVLFLLDGKVDVYFGDEASLVDEVEHPWTLHPMEPGETLYVQSGCPYRVIAHEDSRIIEIANDSRDDPVRIADKYGRADEEEGSEES